MTTPLVVAREHQLVRLNEFLVKALTGQGQVCFVAGEPGAGKTTLVGEFTRTAQTGYPDLIVALADCNAQTGSGDPYLPFREILSLLTGDVESDLGQGNVTEENASRLRRFLRVSGQALVDAGPDLIGMFIPGGSLLAHMAARLSKGSPLTQRVEALLNERADPSGAGGAPSQPQIFEQYTNVLLAAAAQQPLVLVVDDLQWADAASLNLLFHLGRRIEGSRILLTGTYRPNDVALGRGGERHPLEPVLNELKRYYGEVTINLDRTGEAERRRLVEGLIDSVPNRLDQDFRDALFTHTEGHPLFTAELLRDLQERGDLVQDAEGRWVKAEQVGWESLPARVEAVIAERISRLDEDLRSTLSVASVEGEEFTAEVVARVRREEDRRVALRLSGEAEKRHRLVASQGVRRLGAGRLSSYRFHHSLFQRYVYQSLDEVERSFFHEDVGLALESLYEGHDQEIVARLARHFAEAQNVPKAVSYLLRAGQEAVRLSANQEAILHLTQALELLRTLPESAERDQQEVALLLTLVTPLIATRGYSAAEVGQVLSRGRELAEGIGQTPQIFPLLWGLWVFHTVRVQLQVASGLAERCLSLAEAAGDPALLLEAHGALGVTAFYRGSQSDARYHSEQGCALYDPEEHAAHAFVYGQDPGVVARGFSARSLGLLGDLNGSRERISELTGMTEVLSHRHSLATTYMQLTVTHLLLRAAPQAARWAEKMVAASTEHNLPLYLGMGKMLWGAAVLEDASSTEDRERIEAAMSLTLEGLAEYRATGAGLDIPPCLAALAAAYGKIGRVDEGLEVIHQTLAQVEATGQRYYESELYRVRGNLVLARGADSVDEAERLFQRALDIARQQGAKLLELRAATHLARLWRSQDRHAEAQGIVANTYHDFSNGLDSCDVHEAQAMLNA